MCETCREKYKKKNLHKYSKQQQKESYGERIEDWGTKRIRKDELLADYCLWAYCENQGYQRCATFCLFGNKGKPENSGDGSSPWKSLENAMGGIGKEKSIQDILREQMQNKEYADTGGGGGLGGRPPPSGGGGGGDGPEDEGVAGMLDEFVQVILATAGFLFLYAYIIRGDEIARVGKDILKFIVTRKKSLRLERIGDRWRRLYRRLAKKDQVQRDPFWLERAILNTPTWWHDPVQYKRYLASRLKRSSYS
ncbi:hypothetical protein MKW98_022512 [Papaver atlanticum]|uniref:Uncharacterized protein n=1 Tax=Papaver atlanticum TaxID=357466 RepID=A0AAD4S5T9_9MAGN|nr:hypothetical protein MKW98_022512 [Papaver atlanticum]